MHKRVIPIKSRKIEHRHWILHIRIIPGTKFQNKTIVLIFWTRFTQKWYLRSKSEKVNITTDLCLFKLDENNYVFLVGGDALVYLAEPMHKKVSQHLFGATHRCIIKYLGRCSIKQVGHHGWPTMKLLSSRSSRKCLNYIFYIFFSIGSSILIGYCALLINGTVSLWSALYSFSVAACVMYASHNFTKTNVKTEFQKCINS